MQNNEPGYVLTRKMKMNYYNLKTSAEGKEKDDDNNDDANREGWPAATMHRHCL